MSLPVPAIVAVDVEVLEIRARALASGAFHEQGATDARPFVAFRLAGRPCAVDANLVLRAVLIATPLEVPFADGSACTVAFVEEGPVPIADLAGVAAGTPRRARALDGVAALVVSTEVGPIAVAVEGPLELAEDRVAAAADAGGDASWIRLAGRLGGGASLVDASWLAGWAAKVARP